jgi:NitT/TauT family transport system permease protein
MEPERARLARVLAPPLVTFAAIVVLWELSVRALAVPRFLVPPPSAVLGAIASDAPTLAESMVTTSEGALAGFVLWFGPGLRAVAVSAFIVSVFPVIANTLAGIRGVDPRLRDLFRLYGASRFDTLFKLELPFALPSIATGLRVASGLSVIGAIVGEFVAGFSEGHAGLGITVLAAYRQLRTELLFAAVMLASLLGLGLFSAVNLVSSFVLRRFRAIAIE